MTDGLVFASKLARLPLLDANGSAIGRVDDVILVPAAAGQPPRMLGVVAAVQRRPIVVSANRIGEINAEGVRLWSGSVDLRHFRRRDGELLAIGDLRNRRLGPHTTRVLTDIGLCPSATTARGWEVASVAVREGGGRVRRRPTGVVAWTEAASLFDGGSAASEVARLRDLDDYDLAQALRSLPEGRRRQLADALEDERLADLLEELPEEEQVAMIDDLDPARAAQVIAEMEPDDAVDLLAELPPEVAAALLAAMPPEDAEELERLSRYKHDTAGGLMTTDPVVLAPTTTVAEALARIREYDLAPALAAQVFVTDAPTELPTGTFLGAVGFQRLLREPPSMTVDRCITNELAITPELGDGDVARRLAAYDLIAVAVCDEHGSLVGVVTVDDVLDRLLPRGWRT